MLIKYRGSNKITVKHTTIYTTPPRSTLVTVVLILNFKTTNIDDSPCLLDPYWYNMLWRFGSNGRVVVVSLW